MPMSLDAADTYKLYPENVVVPFAFAGPVTKSAALDGAVLIRQVEQNVGKWALICIPNTCRINSEFVSTGLRILNDKDEIHLKNSRSSVFFSDEVIATIAIYNRSEQPISCPRCRLPINNGAEVVVCPKCRVTHHQDTSASRLCWTYAEGCAICRNPTALDSAYSWPPEGY
jgi:hypothetical protein